MTWRDLTPEQLQQLRIQIDKRLTYLTRLSVRMYAEPRWNDEDEIYMAVRRCADQLYELRTIIDRCHGLKKRGLIK